MRKPVRHNLDTYSIQMSRPHDPETFGRDATGILAQFGMRQNAASKFPEKTSQLIDLGDGTYLLQNTSTRFSYHANTFKDAIRTLQGGTIIKQDKLDARNAKMPASRGFFPAYDSTAPHSTPIVSWDIETGDNDQILSISGVKVAMNRLTGKFEYVDDYSRVFSPTSKNYKTETIHGLIPPVIAKFQKWLGKGKTSFFDQDEVRAFQKGAKNLTHNGSAFDNPRLFPGFYDSPSQRLALSPEGYIDTLMLGEAEWGVGKGRNTLDAIFKRLYNRTPESIGLSHHIANADTIIALLNLQGMYHSKNTRIGLLTRALVNGRGLATEWQDLAANNAGYVSELVRKGGQKVMAYEGSGVIDLSEAGADEVFDLENGGLKAGFSLDNALSAAEQGFGMDMNGFQELADSIKMLATNSASSNAGGINVHSYQGLRYRQALGKALAGYADRSGKPLKGKKLRAFYDALKAESAQQSVSDEFADIIYKQAVKYAQENFVASSKPYFNKQQAYLIKDRAKYAGTPFFSALQNEPEPTLATIAHYEVEKEAFDRQLKSEQAARAAEQQQLAYEQSIIDEGFASVTSDKLGLFNKTHSANVAAKHRMDLADMQSELLSLERGWKIKELHESEGRFAEIQDFAESLNSRSRIEQADRDAKKNPWVWGSNDLMRVEAGAAKGAKEYAKALGEVEEKNKKVVGTLNALNKAIPTYNLMNLPQVALQQYGDIKHAAHGILPGFLEKPIFRLSDATMNLFKQDVAGRNAAWQTANIVGSGLTAVGSRIPGIPGLVTAGAGIATSLISQGYGILTEKKYKEYGEGIQHRLNLLGAGIETLLIPLKLFNQGLRLGVSLWGKMANLLSYRPEYTLQNLNGISWSKGAAMAASDRMLGFENGTIHSMYSNLALQQGNLYTSGMYDEKKLVAAARLGIFNLAYAPMGGNAEEQQIALVDNLFNQMEGASGAQKQSLMTLIGQYDPKLLNTLEQMDKLGMSSFRDFSSFGGWRHYSDAETVKQTRTAHDFDLFKTSMTQGLALGAGKIWDNVARPFAEVLNKVIWDFARGGQIDWAAIRSGLKDVWGKLLNFLGIDDDFKLDIDLNKWLTPIYKAIDFVFDGISKYLGGAIARFIADLSMTKLEGFSWAKLMENIAFSRPLTEGMNLKLHTAWDTLQSAQDAYNDMSASNKTGSQLQVSRLAGSLGSQNPFTTGSKGAKEAWDFITGATGITAEGAMKDNQQFNDLVRLVNFAHGVSGDLKKADIKELLPSLAATLMKSELPNLNTSYLNSYMSDSMGVNNIIDVWGDNTKNTLRMAAGAAQQALDNAGKAGKLDITVKTNDSNLQFENADASGALLQSYKSNSRSVSASVNLR